MTIKSGFFNSISHDRVYTSEDFSGIFDGVIGDGIAQYGDRLEVRPVQGEINKWTVGTGRAWFNSTWILNDAPLLIQANLPSLGYFREDAIFINIDRTTNRTANILYVEGNQSISSEQAYVEPSLPSGDASYRIFRIRWDDTGNVSTADTRSGNGEHDAPYLTWQALFGTGVLPISSGGTGANNVYGARLNLGLGDENGYLPITIDQGGTGATTAKFARQNLGLGLYDAIDPTIEESTSGGLPISSGGTGANSRATAVTNLFPSNITTETDGASRNKYFIGMTGYRESTGYISVLEAQRMLGLVKGTDGETKPRFGGQAISIQKANTLTYGINASVDLTSGSSVKLTGTNANGDGAQTAALGVTGILPKTKGGTGNANGTVDKLTTARPFLINLASSAATNFDGSSAMNTTGTNGKAPGVTGVLGYAHGGTNANSWQAAHLSLGVQVDVLVNSDVKGVGTSASFGNGGKYDALLILAAPQGGGVVSFFVPTAYLSSTRSILLCNEAAYIKCNLAKTSITITEVGPSGMANSHVIKAIYGVNKNS